MKKILVNAYLSLNFGDDLFLKILFERYDNVKWFLNSGDNRYLKIFKDIELEENICTKILKKLKIKKFHSINFEKYDAGVYIGGSMFMESQTWKLDYDKLKYLLDNFNKNSKPYYILGCNFGPYSNKGYEEKYKMLFSKAEDICFRDSYSYEIFKELSNVRIAPDIVSQLKAKGIKKIKE